MAGRSDDGAVVISSPFISHQWFARYRRPVLHDESEIMAARARARLWGMKDNMEQMEQSVSFDSRFKTAAERFGAAQDADELRELFNLAETIRPKRILEIGSYRGGWLYAIAPVCADGAEFLAVDNNGQGQHIEDRRALEEVLRAERKRVRWVQGNSMIPLIMEEVREAMPDVDLLHIDGDHSEEGACSDFNTYGPLVRLGGIIAIHDVDGQPGPQRLWAEILANNVRYWRTHHWCNRNRALPMGIGAVVI